MTRLRLLLCLGAALAIAACGGSGTGETAGTADPAEQAPPDVSAVANVESVDIVPGLSMRQLRAGNGAVAEAGHTAVVHYTGWLYDESAAANRGEKFDSSVDRGTHFEFTLGARRVIRGWDEGVVGMQVGEIRELTIAPELGYGERGFGDLIPPGSTLVFEVELAGLKGSDGEAVTPP